MLKYLIKTQFCFLFAQTFASLSMTQELAQTLQWNGTSTSAMVNAPSSGMEAVKETATGSTLRRTVRIAVSGPKKHLLTNLNCNISWISNECKIHLSTFGSFRIHDRILIIDYQMAALEASLEVLTKCICTDELIQA